MWLSFHLLKLDTNAQPFRARFINSLRQRKPFFGIKVVLSGFTKNAQWRIKKKKKKKKKKNTSTVSPPYSLVLRSSHLNSVQRAIEIHHIKRDDGVFLSCLEEKRSSITYYHLQHYILMFTAVLNLYLGVMVLSCCRVDGAGEHGDLHFGHQRVVDGRIRKPGPIRRPPVCDVGLKDLRCVRKIQEFLSVIFHSGSITRIIAGIVKSNHP